MTDTSQHSAWLLSTTEAKNPAALERVKLAKRRIQSILDRETVAHQKTLEQKIADQGPRGQRVDPHLIGLGIKDLIALNRLTRYNHSNAQWYANIGTQKQAVENRLAEIGPLHARVTRDGFGNLIGDALEIIVFKCLTQVQLQSRRYSFQGYFLLNEPKTQHGRYRKLQPPRTSLRALLKKRLTFCNMGTTPARLVLNARTTANGSTQTTRALKP